MKKFGLLIILFVIIPSLFLKADVIRTSTSTSYTGLQYIYEDPCQGAGNDCEVVTDILIMTITTTVNPNGRYDLKIGINSVDEMCTPNSTTNIMPYSNHSNGENYTFKNGTTITLTNMDDAPELNGKIINIGGLTTDANGIFHFLIN